MSTRIAQNFDFENCLSGTYPPAYRGPLMAAPESEAAAVARLDRELESRKEGLRCTRGLLIGILLEIGMAILLYGVCHAAWYLWHLYR
ncbi:MAG TPA: hypothetical protein VMU48_02765 [Terracidiphilus sp.]|nr:hypothetical protein [Terracidiphilus sp.]